MIHSNAPPVHESTCAQTWLVMRPSWWMPDSKPTATTNHTLRRRALTNLRAPKAAISPAARVTAKETHVSSPQEPEPTPKASAVTPAPVSAKTETWSAR